MLTPAPKSPDTAASRQAIPPLKVAMVASLTYSLTNFRLELMKAMIAAGHQVTAFGPENDPDVVARLRDAGIAFVRIPMERTGLNPLADLRTLSALVREFRKLRPDVILPYTMKPVIYGGMAAQIAGVPRQYALMTGLGYIFSDEGMSLKKRLVRTASVLLYKLGMRRMDALFIYNDADAEDIRRFAMVGERCRKVPVFGSGVDLDHYTPSPVPDGPVRFLLVSRLLADKGIREFVAAAKLVRARHPEARFGLLGPLDPNPTGIGRSEIDAWVAEGHVEYLGETRDVRPYLKDASVIVLPSYYREGIPRTLLEALATGRAIITSNMPGCRDTVVPGENGLLVEPKSVTALAEAMETLAKDPAAVSRMGGKSLELARERFDVRKINRHLLEQMHLA